MRKGRWLALCVLFTSGALAQDFADYGQPAKMRQFSTGWYAENSLAMRQYALGLFAVLSKHCSAPEPIRLSANRLRTKVAELAKPAESPGAMKDAEKFHAAHGCDEGRALRINVYRYINENQEPPRSAHYASQPPSLFNACMRDQIRQWEDANDTPDESSIGSWCTCNVNQVDRYLTDEDRKAFLENFSRYYDKIENERIYRLLTRLNACKR
jgi:hypothetical protein